MPMLRSPSFQMSNIGSSSHLFVILLQIMDLEKQIKAGTKFAEFACIFFFFFFFIRVVGEVSNPAYFDFSPNLVGSNRYK